MNREIEVSLDHIQEDLSAIVNFDISFHRDSHGAPYGYEEWVEYDINKAIFFLGFNVVTPSPELKKEIDKEINKQILSDVGNRQSWEVA